METQKKVEEFSSLDEAVAKCKFVETPLQTRQLDTVMAETRMKLDNAIQAILAESALPLYLFDYLISSIQSDIRKADADIVRMKSDLENNQTDTGETK